jgi:SAM-dependent methyltransferase
VKPYLEGALRADFDAWLEAAVKRHSPPLTFPEIRKGVRALSALYVEGRGAGRVASRAAGGAGKRAALATYYAPLHFLTVHHALRELEAGSWRAPRRLFDLGCGSGAAGAALARTWETPPGLVLVDSSASALAEARHTLAAFGLRGRTRRARLPGAAPRPAPAIAVVLSFAVNELDPAARERLLVSLRGLAGRGALLLVVEPLASWAAPWWADWIAALAPAGVEAREVRFRLERPAWIEAMDRAAGLDHQELRARVLFSPGRER